MTERYLRFCCEYWEHCCYSYMEFKQLFDFYTFTEEEQTLFCHRCFQVITATSANPTLSPTLCFGETHECQIDYFPCSLVTKTYEKDVIKQKLHLLIAYDDGVTVGDFTTGDLRGFSDTPHHWNPLSYQ